MAGAYANWNLRVVRRALERDGWFQIDHVGSHLQYKHATKPGKVTVPRGKDPIPEGTPRSVLRQAGLTIEDLERHA